MQKPGRPPEQRAGTDQGDVKVLDPLKSFVHGETTVGER
jgi:hypothetical protein